MALVPHRWWMACSLVATAVVAFLWIHSLSDPVGDASGPDLVEDAFGPRGDAGWNGTQGRLPLAFVENQGQWDDAIRFAVLHSPMRSALTDRGVIVQLLRREKEGERLPGDLSDFTAATTVEGWNVSLEFEGSLAAPVVAGREQLAGFYHYLLGPDPEAWHRHVPSGVTSTPRCFTRLA